jgi:hypothetical protein
MVARQDRARCAIIVWDEGPTRAISATIAAHLKDGLEREAYAMRNGGDARGGRRRGEKVEAVYSTPFLAHAARWSR